MSGPCCTVMNAVSYSIVTDRAYTINPLQKWWGTMSARGKLYRWRQLQR